MLAPLPSIINYTIEFYINRSRTQYRQTQFIISACIESKNYINPITKHRVTVYIDYMYRGLL